MEEKDVTQEPSTEETEVVGEETTPQEATETQSETPIIPSAEVTAVPSDVDELGVPWRNRAAEWKRKSEDNTTQLSELKEMVQGLQNTQQQPKYTKEQLMEFVSRDETEPGHRTWALKEMDRLEEQKVSDTIRKEFTTYETKHNAERVRTETFNLVTQRHPDLIIKDNAGRKVGWNTKSPIVQRMDAYMRNPEIANNPNGLRVALALAKDDLSGTQVASQQKLKAQVKTLQKGTMVEGGSPAPTGGVDSLSRAKENLRKTGSKKDALDAVAAWHKKQGKFEE